MVNRCLWLLSACGANPGVRQCTPFSAPSAPPCPSVIEVLSKYTPRRCCFTCHQVVYKSLISRFTLHMHDVQLRTSDEEKWLSSKNTTKEIIDLHLLCAQRCHPRRRPLPEVPSRPSVLFTVALKPRTGTAICFCPLSDFIYSRSLAVKLEIYDLLFN